MERLARVRRTMPALRTATLIMLAAMMSTASSAWAQHGLQQYGIQQPSGAALYGDRIAGLILTALLGFAVDQDNAGAQFSLGSIKSVCAGTESFTAQARR